MRKSVILCLSAMTFECAAVIVASVLYGDEGTFFALLPCLLVNLFVLPFFYVFLNERSFWE